MESETLKREALLAEPELTIPEVGSPEWSVNLSKPEWLKVKIGTDRGYAAVNKAIKSRCLHTVCQEARCPNISECWTSGTATFMIMGDICTRGCAYCAVKTGRPAPLDADEPERVARAVLNLKLDYAVITSVDRDDLPDGGAGHFASVIRAVREKVPGCKIEVLIPDFGGDLKALELVLEAGPDVLNHNIETVKRLYKRLRAKGDYRRCLDILKYAKERMPAGKRTKSGLMVGLGESCREILELMDDLRRAGTDILTVGQYLRPGLKNVPVMKYRSPEEFAFFREEGLKRGFGFVESGPLVRSSYRAASHCGG